MLSNRPMTKKEACFRANYLRRERLKKIKEENVDEYQQYLKKRREQRKRRIERLKSEDGGQGYGRELARGRRNGKRYREKIKKDDNVYRRYKAQRADEQRTRMKTYRATLHETYAKKLLRGQGFEKTEITEQLIEIKKLHVKIKRLISGNNESQKPVDKYLNNNFNLKTYRRKK